MSILLVEGDPRSRARYQAALDRVAPAQGVCVVGSVQPAIETMARQMPGMVILSLGPAEADGADLLAWMRDEPRVRDVPVLILRGRPLTRADLKALEQHVRLCLQRGEPHPTQAFGDALPQPASPLVRRAVAYLRQHYARPLSRWELAQAAGVSEDYLSRVFYRELGLLPWDYLRRYRIEQARALLRGGDDSIGALALKVGFRDQGYFSRVFRQLTGLSPTAYREQGEQ